MTAATRRFALQLGPLLGWARDGGHAARAPGEPSWLPAPEAVARARRRLERRGVSQWLRSNPAAVAAGPSAGLVLAWWLGAGLWLVLWPAALALQLAASGLSAVSAVSGLPALDGLLPAPPLSWLPLPAIALPVWLPPLPAAGCAAAAGWLPALLAAAHMALLAWPARHGRRGRDHRRLLKRFRQVSGLAEMLALDPEEFEAWCGVMFRLLGFRVSNTPEGADHGVDLELDDGQLPLSTLGGGARPPGPGGSRGLVQCKRYRGTVGEPVVRDLYGTMVHAGAQAGWLVTTGGISRQARVWAAGKPIELWDGQQLLEVARLAGGRA